MSLPGPAASSAAKLRFGCMAAIGLFVIAISGTVQAQTSTVYPDPTRTTEPADVLSATTDQPKPAKPQADPKAGRARGKSNADRTAADQPAPRLDPLGTQDSRPPGLVDPLSPIPGLGDPDPSSGRNITATGRTMPPTSGRAMPGQPGQIKASTQADMLRAQKEAEARNKAWDAKMKKTMGSICSGC